MNKVIDFPVKIDEENNEISVDEYGIKVNVKLPKKYNKYFKVSKWVLLIISVFLMTYGITLVVP